MITHFCDLVKKPSVAVCKVIRPSDLVVSVTSLMAAETPCKKCLEWVVEQGQLASRRLDDLYVAKLEKEPCP